MAKIVLRRVTKSFGQKVAVDDLNLEVEDGEFVIVVGPSGCGKTTTLRMIAGFETPNMGTLHIGGTLMNHVPPKDRNLAMVFQNYALFPHMSVERNLSFGLRIRHTSKKELNTQVHEIAEMLGIRPCWTASPRSSPAASASGSPSDGHCCASRRRSCSTSRCPTSMRRCAPRCDSSSSASTPSSR